MYKINFYLFYLTAKFVFLNLVIISFFIAFLNLIEISRILDRDTQSLYYYLITTIFKLPSIINESAALITDDSLFSAKG